jgi:signal transduction histidine kinase/ligand-binding sensor domain-containing protein
MTIFQVMLWLWCAGVVLGLDPQYRLTQYHKRHWQVEDGLPRNYIMSILPDTEGYLLVATDEGLMRFDGVRFTPYAIERRLDLPRRWVLAMSRAAEGSLWMGTFDGSLYQLKHGHLVSAYQAGDSVFSVLDDGDGRIWASTRGGVLRSQGAQAGAAEFRHVEGLGRPLDTSWNVLARDRDGSVWIVTVDGLFHAAGDRVTHVVRRGGAWGELLAVYCASSGRIWAGTSRGLYELRDRARLQRIADFNAPVVSLLSDRDGSLWVGTWGKGLFRIGRDGRADAWGAGEATADEFIRTLYEDREGNLWIGTRTGGLWRWRDGPARPYGVAEGLAGNFASTVTGAADGTLWFGTWRGGLYRYRNAGFEPQPTAVPTLYLTIRALAVDRGGRPWIGNWEGLSEYDGRRYRHYFDAHSPCYHVSAILFDRAGRVWVGTANNGHFRFPTGRPVESQAEVYLGGSEVTSLVEDGEGRVWASTAAGVVWFDQATHPAEYDAGLPARAPVASLSADRNGHIWAATTAGELVSLSAGGPPRIVGARQGLPAWPLYRIVDDRAGAYWVSSARGILRIAAAELERAASGAAKRLDYSTYNQEDGLRTIECHGLSQPAGWPDPRGGVWFPTTRGFVHVQSYPPAELVPPPPRLEEVTVDGAPAGAPVLKLAPAIRAFDIRYTAFHYATAAKIQFRYRMEGFDPDWIEAGAERDARYSRLPPGAYRFLVSARLPGGEWSTAPAALNVVQLPRFYQTRWWFVLVGLLAVSGVYGLVRWQVHLTHSRYAAVLGERNRIAREWHDTLLAGFAAIAWQLDETLSRLRESPLRALETVELALKMVKYYRAEARRVIWDLRDNRPPSEMLAEAMTSSLRQFGEMAGGVPLVRVTGEAVKLGEELERHLLRICQEAVSNARRNGQATRIEVELAYRSDSIRLRVSDDGCGFEPGGLAGMASGHFGLAVMEERAQRCGGRFRLVSRPGQGTTVEVTVPTSGHKLR